ncbi:MAG: tRNA (adenosine(37)-N6)-threonylcarbamoyltransferase complex ATPase subunit type 1 TsaE [Chloroflexi bacterium]|nr:tRNA (adenosine(37)-N6)-threonylcarbamoyltransferase complex ATPase subunit type 1 TsaE [Chloroflexota bacterium]
MHRSRAASSVTELRSSSPDHTRELGRRLGTAAAPGIVLALFGPLGAGKTQLAKGVAEGLAVSGVVNSPTFVLMNEHHGRMPLYHIDAYRLDDPEEAIAAGLLDERQSDGVTVVEWADRLAGWLPAERLEIKLEAVQGAPMSRTLRWRALGAPHSALADRTLGEAARAGEVSAAT